MHARRLAAPGAPAASAAGRSGPGRLATLAIMAVTAAVILATAVLVNRPTTATGGLTPVDLIGSPTGPAPIVGQPVPPLTATTVDGEAIDLAAFAGRPLWITFGASWCQPCRAENPDIQAAFEAYRGRDLVVVQLFMSEDPTIVAEYVGRVGLSYTAVPDPDARLATEYRILGIPSHFFVDRSGVIREVKVGTLDRASMDAILTELTR